MRRPRAAIPAVVLALAIAGGASVGPRDAELGRLAADGPVTLVSDRPGVALLQADRIKPGDRVSGMVSLRNDGDHSGTLALAVTGLRDRPGANGGLLSRVLRLRVEDLSGVTAPLETVIDSASTFALGRLAGRETRGYRVTAIFPDTGRPPGPLAGDNLQQGSSVEVGLEWQLSAVQAPASPPVATPVPAAPAPPGGPPAATATGPARPVLIRLRISPQRVLKPRGLAVQAECEVRCRLRFTARLDTAPRGGKRRRTLQGKQVLIGERRWRTLRAGREQRVFLKLRPKARRRLKRQLHRRGRAGITVQAHMRSAAGNRSARRRIVMRTYKRGERRAGPRS